MMPDEQLQARAEAIMAGLVQVLATKGLTAATEMLAEHLRSFRGAASAAVSERNDRLVEQVSELMEWVCDAPDEAVAKVKAYNKIEKLLKGGAEE